MARRVIVEGEVTGMRAIMTKFDEMTLKHKKKLRATVGYKAKYAAKIHEDLEMFHSNGQAKYLEQPARQYRKEMAEITRKNLQNKESLETSMRRAAEFLLERSQELVPVDTGFLKNSGYVKVD